MTAIRTFTFDEPDDMVAGGFNDISLSEEDVESAEVDGLELTEADDAQAADEDPEPPPGAETPEAAPIEEEAAGPDAPPLTVEDGLTPSAADAPQPPDGTPAPDAQIKLMLAKQQAQIDYLSGLLSQTGGKPAPAEISQGAPESQPAPQLTEEEIIDDPVGAISKAVDTKIAQFKQEQAAAQQTQQSQSELKAQQERAWSTLQENAPAFRDKDVQQLWANVFYNPANDFQNDPVGPIRAANAVANMLRGAGVNPGQDPSGTAPPAAPADIKTVEAKAAEAERARQARVRKSAMHGSGKGGNRQKVTGLTPQHLALAKEFGVDPKAVESVINSKGGE